MPRRLLPRHFRRQTAQAHGDNTPDQAITATRSSPTDNAPVSTTRKVSILSRLSITCPFHGSAQWRHIRDTSPEEWQDVVAFDAAIRKGNARANAAERAALQGELTDTYKLEHGVTDGCSPWACRGGADALTQDDLGLAS